MEQPVYEEHMCDECGGNSKVADSRPGPGGWKRRRECLDCGLKWNTLENRTTVSPGEDEINYRLRKLKEARVNTFRCAKGLLKTLGIELGMDEKEFEL